MSKPNTVSLFILFLISAALLSTAGCSGKKKAVVKNYGKPQWYQVDLSKFVELSKDETAPPEGGGKIIIYDPVGWDRIGAGKAPKGFSSVIRFQKGDTVILMTKSKGAKDMDELDKENVEGFAESAQQLFKTKVEMVELGNIVGVMFRKAGKASQSVSGKKLERRVVATSIGGELYTYELIADAGKITNAMLYTLFSVVAKTKIETANNTEANSTEVAEVEKKEKVKEPAAEKPAEVKTAEESKPVEVAVKETPAETKPEPKQEVKETPVEVASSPAAEKKPEVKAEPKPAKKKKGNTQNILNELDALLNN